MELRDTEGRLPGERFGILLEPDADTFQMDIPRVRRALDQGVTLAGRTGLVIDSEDTFTYMLDQQLRALGLDVTVRAATTNRTASTLTTS